MWRNAIEYEVKSVKVEIVKIRELRISLLGSEKRNSNPTRVYRRKPDAGARGGERRRETPVLRSLEY